ncbi:hypothetical protein [Streptomyces nitrosporeus]
MTEPEQQPIHTPVQQPGNALDPEDVLANLIWLQETRAERLAANQRNN